MDNVIHEYSNYCSYFTFKYRNLNTENKQKFNGSYISAKEKLIYLHIDKCASTSISSALQKSAFIDMINFSEDDINLLLCTKKYRSFCVIRDPVKRWISGIGEFMNRFDGSIDYIVEQVKNKKYIFDLHTAPQHLSIDPYITKLTNTYLKMDSGLEDKINKLILYSNKITLNVERESNLITKLTCEKIFEKYVKINLNYFYKLYEKDFILYGKSI
jgi:hypothetical protein